MLACLLPNVTSSASPGALEGVQVETTVSEINIVFYDEYQRFGTRGEVDSIPRGVCRHEDGHIRPTSTLLLPLLTPSAHISRKYSPWSTVFLVTPSSLAAIMDGSRWQQLRPPFMFDLCSNACRPTRTFGRLLRFRRCSSFTRCGGHHYSDAATCSCHPESTEIMEVAGSEGLEGFSGLSRSTVLALV